MPAWQEDSGDENLKARCQAVGSAPIHATSTYTSDGEWQAELQTDLEAAMESICQDMQQKFSLELRSRLKILEQRAEARSAAQRLLSCTDVCHFDESHCESRREEAPKEPRLKQRLERAQKLPIKLPTAELQAATIAHDFSRGQAQARQELLAAGFLGGSGRITQAMWFALGCIGMVQRRTSHDAALWGVGACGFACLLMRFVMKIWITCTGLMCFARFYFLRRGSNAGAHMALLIGLSIGIVSWLVVGVLSLYLTWSLGCAWRDERHVFHAAGSACAQLSFLDTMMSLMLVLPLSLLVKCLWQVRLKYASKMFSILLLLDIGRVFLPMTVELYHGGERMALVLGVLVHIAPRLCVLTTLQIWRYLNQKKAWKLVASDAENYQKVWLDIVRQHAAGVQELSEVAKKVLTDIQAAAQQGPQHELCEAENQRRTLLYGFGGALLQSISSLPLLFAQAGATNEQFQRKCAEWAAGIAEHIAAPIKRPSRAIQKVWRSYTGNPQALVDLVRSSIVCETPQQALAVLRRVQADRAANIVRIKNRFDPCFDARICGGYRSLSLNLIIVNLETCAMCAERHICELQIGLREIDAMKTDGGHRRFVQFRDSVAE
eukprot:TRINITY_DN16428_c0_g1_i1.p1 TRINITY_DN16428_c0_g1~~TRINITY_DN16428_c0_g1_i1.p1  ORF type:complete len:671 (+),score=51.04 TRINITY_DN16428_c0_g1_i1:196-2013(+)